MELERKKDKTGQSTDRLSGSWIVARKIVQYLCLAFFLVLFVWAGRSSAPQLLVNLPMLLDPLLQIAYLLASRTFLLVSSLALIVLLLSLVFGRAWCGWICPLGTTLDIFSPGRLRNKNSDRWKPGESWRVVKYGLLIAILAAALFENLTLLILDPLTVIFRTLTDSLWPALGALLTKAESLLYNIPLLKVPIGTLDAKLRPGLFPVEPVFYRAALFYAGIFLGIVMLNYVTPRFWCRYLCPLGAMLGLLSKLALFRRQVTQDCKGCTLCTRICPTGTIDPQRNYASDPSECTMCLDCLEICPRSSIDFSPGFSPTSWREYDPDRRQFLAVAGLTLASLAVLQVDARKKSLPPFLLRPPGVVENDFLASCIRCSECMRACPTGALQPLVAESSIEALWTPVVIPRLGYCDYSCNACGQICPVQAIPALPIDEKQQQVIGKAYINRDRCIAWSDGIGCIVCEEMCPLPEKAIKLELLHKMDYQGGLTEVQVPYVNRDLCIGCGICENKCPVASEAAIRVFIPNVEQPI